MNKLDQRPINENITFTTQHKNLYKRLHNCIGGNNRSEVMRELIDIGLKSKGY